MMINRLGCYNWQSILPKKIGYGFFISPVLLYFNKNLDQKTSVERYLSRRLFHKYQFKCKHEEDPLAFLFAYRKVNENTCLLSV